MRTALLVAAANALCQVLPAATYYVDGAAANAADENPGTEALPWKTIARAGGAPELRPGDTVLIKTGVYREHARITVSGEEGQPITFAAAPGAKVVVKGSEVVKGRWTRLSEDPSIPEPYPNAFQNVWKIELGDGFFTDPDFPGSYQDKATRWVSQVYLQDYRALQLIGDDRIYTNEPYARLRTVGRGLNDLVMDSFFFDPATQTLYIEIGGDPSWYSIEVGVRGWVLSASEVHDVVIRGLELRQNRQPGGQWPMVNLGGCERVTIEDCRVSQADFCGLGLGRSKNCTVRRCDLSYNGNTGLGMGECEDCVVEDCRVFFNNYRRFHPGWHAGGMKCIPRNRRCTVRGCEVAYNLNSDGIWFDAENEDIRILGNVSHHNDGCGIFYEINPGGGVIADNLVYGNHGRGIYLSGSQSVYVLHNTVAYNDCGIVCMPREDPFTLERVTILNNLLIDNYVIGERGPRGCDLTVFMGSPGEYEPYERTVVTNHSDHNVYSSLTWSPTMRHSWNPDNTLEQWQERWQEDGNSRRLPMACELPGMGFRLLTTEGLDIAGPVPVAAGWQPALPGRVGCARTQWPE
jgi:parallel beta-helix repeat protein